MGDEVWVEVTEEIREEAIAAAVSADTLALVDTTSGNALSFVCEQPVTTGKQARRRLVLRVDPADVASWPVEGQDVELQIGAAALEDLFGNTASADYSVSFAWPSGDVVIEDTAAPRVEQVTVLETGELEVRLSESVDLAAFATELQVDGQSLGWVADVDGYAVRTDGALAPGGYDLALGTGGIDLSGKGVDQPFTASVNVSSPGGTTISARLVYEEPDPALVPMSTIGNRIGFHGLDADPVTGLIYARNRFYDPEIGRFLTTDPMGYIDGPSMYQYGLNNPFNYTDPMGLAVYAFDGTNNDRDKMVNPTNVAILCGLVDEAKTRCFYREGVGSSLIAKVLGGLGGAGGRLRLEWMYDRLVEAYNAGDTEIDIIGFSRGAALARAFANMIHQRGIPDLSSAREVTYNTKDGEVTATVYDRYISAPRIRFMGLFDTVGSFGLPGNRVNLGYDLSIPPNVENVSHAVSRDERRGLFPLTSVLSGPGDLGDSRLVERQFPGVHSDVGGGYEDNNGLSMTPDINGTSFATGCARSSAFLRGCGRSTIPRPGTSRVAVPSS